MSLRDLSRRSEERYQKDAKEGLRASTPPTVSLEATISERLTTTYAPTQPAPAKASLHFLHVQLPSRPSSPDPPSTLSSHMRALAGVNDAYWAVRSTSRKQRPDLLGNTHTKGKKSINA